MPKVKLKDVVMRVKEKVDKDNTDLEYYVGGEHIDGNEICVSRRGVIQGSTIGPAFHMAFKAGDVLLMSRNPHLRKASMADFDGICSDVSYICRTKDESVLLQSFLPFLMQTNDFWRFAEENKKGGCLDVETNILSGITPSVDFILLSVNSICLFEIQYL